MAARVTQAVAIVQEIPEHAARISQSVALVQEIPARAARISQVVILVQELIAPEVVAQVGGPVAGSWIGSAYTS